jgi:hypothetical protein
MTPRRAPLLGLLMGASVAGAGLFLAEVLTKRAVEPPCETATSQEEVIADTARRVHMAAVVLPPPPQPPSVQTAPLPQKLASTASSVRPADPAPADPVAAPEPGRAIKSAAAKRSEPFVPPKLVFAGTEQETAGRPLLRLLEHGEGPRVEIAWPDHRVARAKLYQLLARCHGLRTVLLRGQEILISTASNRNEVFNSDRHSGFLRTIDGMSPQAEERALAALRAAHGGDGVPARLLSRSFDARLLGGLERLAGPGYRGAGTVTARYAIAGDRVLVHGLSVDGRAIEGRIEIAPPPRCDGAGS